MRAPGILWLGPKMLVPKEVGLSWQITKYTHESSSKMLREEIELSIEMEEENLAMAKIIMVSTRIRA